MSKKMTADELLKHTSEAAKDIVALLTDFRESTCDLIQKRAALLAYWFKAYCKLIRKEDSFAPESVFRLKRGSIISVEFGYRIGAEIGGKHYAVVLDVNNDYHSGVVTVLPLGSIKEKSRNSRHMLILEDGIFTPLSTKLFTLLESTDRTLTEIEEKDANIDALSPEEAAEWKIIRRSKIEDAKKLALSCRRHLEEINHLKPGSVAHLSQITTISKMRILAPLHKAHPLYGVKLTDEELTKIDNALKEKLFR